MNPTPPPPTETAMTDRRICPTCCHFRDADVPCSDAFHIAPPSETKLKEALDKWEEATGARNYVYAAPLSVAPGEIVKAEAAADAARSSLESLYREQAKRIEELEGMLAGFDVSKSEGGYGVHYAALRFQYDKIASLAEAYSVELSASRPLQLTQDEAKHILNHNLNPGFVDPDAGVVCEVCRDADGKLRRISSKATSEEL